MNFAKGDRVLVNVAPFIGSTRRAKDSVACEIVGAADDLVQVRTEPPCRSVVLWVHSKWIEGKLETCQVCHSVAMSASV